MHSRMECCPVPQRAVGLILVRAHTQTAGSIPGEGACKRQPIDVFSPPFLSLKTSTWVRFKKKKSFALTREA